MLHGKDRIAETDGDTVFLHNSFFLGVGFIAHTPASQLVGTAGNGVLTVLPGFIQEAIVELLDEPADVLTHARQIGVCQIGQHLDEGRHFLGGKLFGC